MQLAKGMARLAHVDDPQQLRFWTEYLDRGQDARVDRVAESRAAMLHVSLWGQGGASLKMEGAEAKLKVNPSALEDLKQLAALRLEQTRTLGGGSVPDAARTLALHGHYTRDEILTGLGYWTLNRRPDVRQGVIHLPEPKLDVFFVTLHKTEESYSPTTMYDDYVISDRLFHWQSQSTTSDTSPTGKRYVGHREMGYTPLLFVRDHRKQPGGIAAPYVFLGPADYVSHTGSRPMSITWRLRSPMPVRLVHEARG